MSVPALPKQFAGLLGGGSLFEMCLRRVSAEHGFGKPIVVTSADHLDLVSRALAETESWLIIAEPTGRNTAAAAIAAALVSDPADTLVILPSDHLIADDDGFRDAVATASSHAEQGALVTFGVTPTRAETGYGYIEVGEPLGDAHRVRRFTEKPTAEEAARLIEGGRLWNSGMFVVAAGTLLEEANHHCPEIVHGVSAALTEPVGNILRLGDEFSDVPSQPFDSAIMEKTSRGVVVATDIGWSDIGSFQSLWESLPRDGSNNVVVGDVLAKEVSGSLVIANSRTVAVAGVEGLVVVETEDAVLVVPRDRSQLVRDLVADVSSGTEDPD